MRAGGNIYFDTSKLKDYYVFSSQSEKELMVGVRDDVMRIAIRRIRVTSFCGSPNPSSMIRS